MIHFNKHLESITPYVVKSKFDSSYVKLIANENPLGTSPNVQKAIAVQNESYADYPCIQCAILKEKLAKNLQVSTENLLIGNGSDEIFTFIAGAVIKQGAEMITAQATFSQFAFATKLFGGTPIYTELDNGKFSPENILNAITPNTKWISIANPNNPTGTYLTQNELKQLLDQIPKNILVMIDEAYIEYATAPDIAQAIHLLPNYENIIITRTFSKIYGLAAMRVGYAIAHPKIISFLNKLRSPYNINALGQLAATIALDDQSFIRESVKNNVIGKQFLESEFDELGLKYYPTQGNFIFVHFPVSGSIIANALEEEGVLVRPAGSFGVENAVRITIGKPQENEFFALKLKKVMSNIKHKDTHLMHVH